MLLDGRGKRSSRNNVCVWHRLSQIARIVDVDLKKLRGQSLRFTHTRYWTLPRNLAALPAHIKELRKALDLGGRLRNL